MFQNEKAIQINKEMKEALIGTQITSHDLHGYIAANFIYEY